MSLLSDAEIETLLRASPPLIENFDTSNIGVPSSPVRGASLDLTVGEIFLPGAGANELGSIAKPRSAILLSPGQTAVVRTAEKINMPRDIAGIGFPPSTQVSLAGLLTTNPGHIDPDYKGHLHLTVINMGSTDFELSLGDRILRLILFKMSQPALRKVGNARPVISDELLLRLSNDFMNIDKRCSELADKAVAKAELNIKSRQVWIPLAGTVITGLAALFYYSYSGYVELKTEIAKSQGQLSGMSSLVTLGSIDERLKALQSIETRLTVVETAIQRQLSNSSAPSAPSAPQNRK